LRRKWLQYPPGTGGRGRAPGLRAKTARARCIDQSCPNCQGPARQDRDVGIDEDDDDEDEEDAVLVGATPLSLAVARGHEDVAALLQQHDETRHLGLREHEQLATVSYTLKTSLELIHKFKSL